MDILIGVVFGWCLGTAPFAVPMLIEAWLQRKWRRPAGQRFVTSHSVGQTVPGKWRNGCPVSLDELVMDHEGKHTLRDCVDKFDNRLNFVGTPERSPETRDDRAARLIGEAIVAGTRKVL